MRGVMSRCPASPRWNGIFSLLLTDDVRFADVTKVIESLGIAEITSIEARFVSREKCAGGKIFTVVRITFQSKAATLTDAQISDFSAELWRRLGRICRPVAGELKFPSYFGFPIHWILRGQG